MVVNCPKCLGEFATQRDLERHLQRKTPCDAGNVKCTGCATFFTSDRGLKDHIKKGRCKGKSLALVNSELAEQVEHLKTQAEQHEQLLQMTNSATAAAAESSSSITNFTQNVHNHITINIDQRTHVSGLGQEKLSHFSKLSDEDSLSKLRLTKGPALMGNWCAMLRADENHPENHNALLLTADSKEMACCREGKWQWEATDKILLEISRTDMMRLYTHLGRYDQNVTAQAFRHEYLLHDLMARSNTGSADDLKPFMHALAQPIIALTQKFYATTLVESTDSNPAAERLLKTIDELKQTIVEERAQFEQREAKRLALLMSLQRQATERNLESIE